MGEALDKVTKNLGLDKKPGSGEGGEPKTDAMTELDAAIATIGNIEAKELLQMKARELRSQMELRSEQAKAEVRKVKEGDHAGRNGGEADEKIKSKKDLIGNALVLIDKGVDPDVVTRYIIGSQGAAYPVNLGGGGQQGLTIADIKTILDMVKPAGGPDPQTTTILNQLTETVKGLKPVGSTAPADPVAMLKAQTEAITNLVNGLVEAGLVQRPGTGNQGKTIEELKEENRHSEKLEELRTDKDYKASITEIAGSIPERIGRGIASDMRQKSGLGGGKESQLESFPCEKCGAKIFVTPETGNKVKCGACGMVYERDIQGKEAASGKSAPGKAPANTGR